MKLFACNFRSISQVALLCTLGGALLSVSATSSAASKTLTISGTPSPSATVDAEYSFQPTGKDTVKSRIKYDIYNKPAWMEFDQTTGRLYGRPNRRQIGKYTSISIRMTDWYGFVATPYFSITVVAAATKPPVLVNTPPTITGRAATAVNAGSAYTFTPKAADTDGNKLSFSIRNQPGWTQFSATSGTLSGTPSAAEVGTYANIQISVSDGKASTALPAFTIAVNQMSACNATLNWIPPTENTDGSVLTNLAGYNLHYGKSPNALTEVVKVSNPGLASYVVDNLSAGTWYFAVTSYTTGGMESTQSAVVSTTIL